MYKLAINRPITTIMGVMVFIVFGLISYKSMPINLFPSVDIPIVTIQTNYYGADASSVESKVTDEIEDVISGIDGIDKLISTSYDGLSLVTVQFELSRDIVECANDVRDKVGGVSLPSDVEKPIVKKLSASGGSVINLFLSTKNSDTQALMLLADEKIKPKLQRIEGVGEVSIVGYRDREVRVFADPFLLNKYNISAIELQQIISKENIKLGSGKLISDSNEFIIKAKGDASSIDELKEINIKSGVKLKDIAKVEDYLSDSQSFASLNSQEGVMLEIKKISGENALDIIKGVKAVMPELEKIAGSDYVLTLLQDQSEKILQNIEQVTFDLIYGAILAIIIVFLFLRNISATIISALAIPTSIIGTFAIIDWLGYDLNRLTLIGLTLAIGIFIDDAIVVIENITKKMESGMKPFEATYEGVKEIAFSVLAISSMLLAVFIPVAFMGGIVGKFFNSFAMTVASGIVISYLIVIMFVPTLSARFLNAKENWFYRITEPILVGIDKLYIAILKPLIRFYPITILATIGLLFYSGTFAKYLGMEFVPMEDNSEIQIMIKAPIGISLEEMKRKVEPIVEEVKANKYVEYSFLSIGYTTAKEIHKAKIYAKLLPVLKRDLRQDEIVNLFRDRFKSIDDFIISIEEVPPFETGESNSPLQIVIKGDDLDKLNEISLDLIDRMRDVKGLVDVDSDYESGKPEVRISILRENAQRVGVSAEEIAQILGSAYSSDRAVSKFEESGREFDITVRFADEYREAISDIKKLQVKNQNGNFVSLEGLVKFEESETVASINRFDRERKVLVTSNIFETALDEAVKNTDKILNEILPKGYSYRYTGDVERMQETGEAFGAAVILAVILIYLILAGLYESLIQPLIIMVSMPLSFSGIIFALYLSGNNFSLFVLIGIILLLGMVGKNAILVVDFANRAIKDGKNINEALLEAGEKRLRPVLMTTFAMIGAMVPLAFGTGAGFESNSPMALAIIGGLVSSTILTLLVVPAIYKLLYPIDRLLRKIYEKGEVI